MRLNKLKQMLPKLMSFINNKKLRFIISLLINNLNFSFLSLESKMKIQKLLNNAQK